MRVVNFAAAVEAVLGIVVLVSPTLVSRLLFRADLFGVGEVVGRLAGIALLALGLACWGARHGRTPATRGILGYNVFALIFFIDVGVHRDFVGLLLWPAVALHGVLAVALAAIFIRDPVG